MVAHDCARRHLREKTSLEDSQNIRLIVWIQETLSFTNQAKSVQWFLRVAISSELEVDSKSGEGGLS